MITSTHSDYRNGSLNLQQSFYTNPDDQPTTNDNYQVKLEGGGQDACEASTVDKISDCQPGGSGLNSRPGQGFNFGRPSFITPSMGRDVNIIPVGLVSRHSITGN